MSANTPAPPLDEATKLDLLLRLFISYMALEDWGETTVLYQSVKLGLNHLNLTCIFSSIFRVLENTGLARLKDQ